MTTVHEADGTTQDHFLSNRFYDVLKNIALVVLPALGALYFSVATIWGLPSPDGVVGTIVAVDTFLGVIIKLGDVSYNASEGRFDGSLNVVPNREGTGGVVNLDLKGNPEALVADKSEVTLKVKTN